jgi:putative glutamine amidotransferase
MSRSQFFCPSLLILGAGMSFVSCKPQTEASTKSVQTTSSRPLRIGLTDTLYAQIRFSVEELGAHAVDLTTSETMQTMFLTEPRPTLLKNRPEAQIVSEDLSKGEAYVRRRWDVSLYKSPAGILDSYIETNRGSARNPSERRFLEPIINMDVIQKQVASLDGLVVGGGEDVNPRLYFAKDLQLPNAQGHIEENTYARTRDIVELAYIGEAIRQGKPVLGICRGAQVLAVALGGKLVQDIPTSYPPLGRRHSMPLEFEKSEGHAIRLPANSLLARIMGLNSANAGTDVKRDGTDFIVNVNSYHHQSVIGEFPSIEVTARDEGATQGKGPAVVEGFVATEPSQLVMGVQFHPERPFAIGDNAVAASALPLPEWKHWFESDTRRPFYRRIFENFLLCAKNDERCIRR